MIKIKNKVFCSKIQLNFITFIKSTKHELTYTKYSTTRVLANKAPKHFNIGQHSMKIRRYFGNKIFFINNWFKGLSPQIVTHDFFFKNLSFQKKLSVTRSIIYYKIIFKFN